MEKELINELVRLEIEKEINNYLDTMEFDFEKKATDVAIKMIEEIQAVLESAHPMSNKDDFEVVEEIVLIFEKYGASAGACHDFG